MKILLFGASSGIGKAVAVRAAQDNHDLMICSRDIVKLDKAVKDIKDRGKGSVAGYSLDLSDGASLKTKLDDIESKFGTPSAILLNGGGPLFASFDQLTVDQWELYINQLIISNVIILKKFLPVTKPGSSVVFILSDVVRQAGPGKILPCSLRMNLLGMMKCLSAEYAAKGVRFNAVSPGSVETDRARSLLQKSADTEGVSFEQMKAKFTSNLPMKRMGTPEEVAEVVYFLLSTSSSYITGANILCDGGASCVPL